MQSGISASQELISQFNLLLADTSIFGLLITISNETLAPVTTLPSTSSNFAQNLEQQLQPRLKPDEALYIILRRYNGGEGGSKDAPRLIVVTYVPDTAKVRQKMLFASTRLTLTRELGSEHFRETIFATTAEELSPAGFERHDRHAAIDAPLTEEERTLGEVKRAEAEAGAGTGIREIHLSKTMNMPIATDALVSLSELSRGEGRGIVILKINRDSETVELVKDSSTPSSIAELVQAIPTTEPRFTFFKYTHTHDGAESSPVLFFYTCPAVAGKEIKYRMMYPLMKRAVLTVAETEAGLKIEKRFEVEEPNEITEDLVLSELHPRAEVKTAFKRPKRPGR
ncbi:hypothetical protein MGN70_010890 [Eutypa lata]|uniref:Twinfilin n=1 Tax=Eutypa lata (strain UCR-EL1) TaxID=1287681 RepID=M7TWZ4_EUTLA|nr:putative cofilin tropomyosin-type actin-binding protein [Eutypa lata UCREL1]KAI1247005.1 hypothetical protein MGN70_010890 [Eutypa lata]